MGPGFEVKSFLDILCSVSPRFCSIDFVGIWHFCRSRTRWHQGASDGANKEMLWSQRGRKRFAEATRAPFGGGLPHVLRHGTRLRDGTRHPPGGVLRGLRQRRVPAVRRPRQETLGACPIRNNGDVFPDRGRNGALVCTTPCARERAFGSHAVRARRPQSGEKAFVGQPPSFPGRRPGRGSTVGEKREAPEPPSP